MRIASFTMVGQFPDGINLHVRNLEWALTDQDHIYIVTLPEHIKQFNLINKEHVTFIPFVYKKKDPFVPFWANFPKILKKLNIDPEWFLFMEEDIWFYQNIDKLPNNPKKIINYLPLQKHYHSIFSNGKLIHPRVWEGANLIHSQIVKKAIERNINFCFVKNFFCESHYWKRVYGEITLGDWNNTPDTFDEFGLYCALWEKTIVEYESRAVHLRGPESLHRYFPNLYQKASEQEILEAQKKLNYMCVYAALGVYYIAGNFEDSILWHKMKPSYKKEYQKVKTAWMLPEEEKRFKELACSLEL